MRKQWMAMLSVLGLAGPAVQSQVVNGTTNGNSQTTNSNKVDKSSIVSPRDPQSGQKLKVNQKTLRQQGGTSNGQKLGQTQTQPASAACTTQVKGNNQLTPPPPGGNNQAVTKGNNQVTKGNNQVTKGNNQVTKGNNQVTKGNNQVTKGNNQVTKGSNQINNNAVPK
jgi:hypothetical protein